MSTVDRDFEFPTELSIQPQALVGVTGLDTLNNAIHRATWDALCNNRRSERAPVQFKLLSPSHEFPRCKTKKTPYELHIPKGILKRNWMHKHLMQIPAVMVIFYDLDWDDPQWDEKKIECTSRVQSIRAALEGRNTKICLVLIQKTAPLPSGEDLIAADRANDLFQTAQLSNKSLFILPHTEHLLGYTAKLEKAFHELSQSYYQYEIRLIKNHRENMNKKTQKYLFVRHNFKMGFFSELRQDMNAAHGYYNEAYSNLLEVQISFTNEFEVKTVAGFIGYKVCRVLFVLKKPRDAISLFKAHIEHYKHKTGHPQLLFQHHAWLSKQYSMFAELFDEMIQHGIPAAQTQHPGFYYKLAAMHAQQRKELTQELCSKTSTYPTPDPLARHNTLEYYGQRPWRPCQLSAEPLDPDLERQGILAIQYNELYNIDQSGIIIGLLGNAVSQFKSHRCPRMRKHLVVEMADEYYLAKDYGKALTLLMHMVWDYRTERWFSVVDRLLRTALCAAYLTARLHEYVSLCLEAIVRLQDPIRILANLNAVANGEVPESEPGLNPNECSMAANLWKQTKSDSPLIIDTQVFMPPIQCKAVIMESKYSSVRINVVLKCNLPEQFTFSKLSVVTCGGSGLPLEHEITSNPSDLTFVGEQLKSFIVTIIPLSEDVGKVLQINSVLLNIGRVEGRIIIMKFNGLGVDLSLAHPPELFAFKKTDGVEEEFFRLKPCLTCMIAKWDPMVNVTLLHDPPSLLGEWYRIKILIQNDETTTATEILVTASFPHNLDNESRMDMELCESTSETILQLPHSFPIPDLPPGSSSELVVFVRCSSQSSRSIDFKVTFLLITENNKRDHCEKHVQAVFDTVEPFSFSASCLTTKFTPVSGLLFSDESFLVQASLRITSPWPVFIHYSTFQEGETIFKDGEYVCPVKGLVINPKEIATCICCFYPTVPSQDPINIASFTVIWSRKGNETMRSEFRHTVGEMKVAFNEITVKIDMPTIASLRALMPLKYSITNKSSTKVHSLALSMDPSNAFLFSGCKQTVLFIQPNSTKVLDYNMYPLVCGSVTLPKLRLKDNELPNLQQMLDRVLPSNIFVMPNAKNENQNENNLHKMLELCDNEEESCDDQLELAENMSESSDKILESCGTMLEVSYDRDESKCSSIVESVDQDGAVISESWQEFYDTLPSTEDTEDT